MVQKKKIVIAITIITAIVFFSFVMLYAVKSVCYYYKDSISGEITHIRYTERKLLKIKINDCENWHLLDVHIKYDVVDIELGDTLLKNPCSYSTYLTKANNTFNISSERNINLFKKLFSNDYN